MALPQSIEILKPATPATPVAWHTVALDQAPVARACAPVPAAKGPGGFP